MARKIDLVPRNVRRRQWAASGMTLALCLFVSACHPKYVVSPDRALVLWRQQSTPTTTVSGGVLQMTCGQIVKLALRKNLSMRRSAAEVDIAKGELRAAGQVENPQLRIKDLELDKIAEGKPAMQLSARFPIPRPGVRSARIAGASAALAGKQAALEHRAQLMRRGIKRRCAKLSILAKEIAFSKGDSALGQAHATFIADRVALGAATTMDLHLAQMNAAQAKDRIKLAIAKRAEVAFELKELMGASPTQELKLAAELNENIKSVQFDTKALVAKALTHRADLKMVAAKVAMAKDHASVELAKRWPWLRFAEVGYEMDSPMDAAAFRVALAIEVPIFDWNSGKIASRKALIKRNEIEEKQLISKTVYAVTRAIARLRRSEKRLNLLEKDSLPAVKKGAELAKQAVAQGAADRVSAFLVAKQRIALRRAHLQARLDRELARIDLEFAIGESL